jgi:hypothetical protein
MGANADIHVEDTAGSRNDFRAVLRRTERYRATRSVRPVQRADVRAVRQAAFTHWSFEQLAGIAAALPEHRTLSAAIASDAINDGLRRQCPPRPDPSAYGATLAITFGPRAAT